MTLATGGRVCVEISEPWEVGERTLDGIVAMHVSTPEERALLKLASPFKYCGVTYTHLVVSPRHEGGGFAQLDGGDGVPCNAIGLLEADGSSLSLNEPLEWRGGGLVVIGTLRRQ